MTESNPVFTIRLSQEAIKGLSEIVALESLFVENEREVTPRGVAAKLIVEGIESWKKDRKRKLERRAAELKMKLEKNRAIA